MRSGRVDINAAKPQSPTRIDCCRTMRKTLLVLVFCGLAACGPPPPLETATPPPIPAPTPTPDEGYKDQLEEGYAGQSEDLRPPLRRLANRNLPETLKRPPK